jgi:predicted nucleotidyltransferase
MNRRELVIQRIVDIVSQSEPNSELYLYGSRARGNSKKSSDWDLLILLNSDQLTFENETRLINNLYEVELETGEVISPLIYTKHDWQARHYATPLYSNISKEGIKLK